jgi:intracellular septation protein A
MTPHVHLPAIPVPIVLPRIRDILRHATPNIVEAKLVPLLLFVGFLEIVGSLSALLVALAWSLGTMAYRRATGRRVPGLVLLSAVALAARTIAAVATGSMLVYFLQPTVSTVLVGLAFLVSIPLGTPLAQRLADDLFPFDADTREHPLIREFFLRLTALWAITSLINASITVWLLVTQSATTFVLVKSVLGPITTTVTLTLGVAWFRHRARRTGTTLVWAVPGVPRT